MEMLSPNYWNGSLGSISHSAIVACSESSKL